MVMIDYLLYGLNQCITDSCLCNISTCQHVYKMWYLVSSVCMQEGACVHICYLSRAAPVTLAVWAARCSGSVLCWGPELQEQVEAAPPVGPPGRSAQKQLGRSSSLHLGRLKKEAHYLYYYETGGWLPLTFNCEVYWKKLCLKIMSHSSTSLLINILLRKIAYAPDIPNNWWQVLQLCSICDALASHPLI